MNDSVQQVPTLNVPVLLLDAAWRVDRVIRSNRAVELLVAERVVAASEEVVALYRAQTIRVEVPAVVAVTGSRVRPRRELICTHRRVRMRDGHECQFVHDGVPCSGRGDSVDHLVPRSVGGPSTWTNLVAACRRCNGSKADRPFDELMERRGWSLRREPFVPSAESLLAATLGRGSPAAWGPYLLGG
jgi:5-methylcytosine-specific restriction endonuclease McrA